MLTAKRVVIFVVDGNAKHRAASSDLDYETICSIFPLDSKSLKNAYTAPDIGDIFIMRYRSGKDTRRMIAGVKGSLNEKRATAFMRVLAEKVGLSFESVEARIPADSEIFASLCKEHPS